MQVEGGWNSGFILFVFAWFVFLLCFFLSFFVFQFVDVLDYLFIVFYQIYELWGTTDLANQ